MDTPSFKEVHIEMELSGHKKTPVPNRGFVPGLPRSYNPFGLETTNIPWNIGNCITRE